MKNVKMRNTTDKMREWMMDEDPVISVLTFQTFLFSCNLLLKDCKNKERNDER